MPAILDAAADAGAKFAGSVTLRLPYAVAPLFEEWLGKHLPDTKEKILNRIRSLRGGKLNDPQFGSRMRGEGIFAEQIGNIFDVARRRAGLMEAGPNLSVAAFRRPDKAQLQLSLTMPQAESRKQKVESGMRGLTMPKAESRKQKIENGMRGRRNGT